MSAAPRIGALPLRQNASNTQLLLELGEAMEPDDRALTQWFENYRHVHRNRLAADLAMIEENTNAGARVLE